LHYYFLISFYLCVIFALLLDLERGEDGGMMRDERRITKGYERAEDRTELTAVKSLSRTELTLSENPRQLCPLHL
jgi:hypothetical protein